MDATFKDVEKLAEAYLQTLLEMNKKYGTPQPAPTYNRSNYNGGNSTYAPKPASDKQKNLINQLLSSKQLPNEEEETIRNSFPTMTTKEASVVIEKLKA